MDMINFATMRHIGKLTELGTVSCLCVFFTLCVYGAAVTTEICRFGEIFNNGTCQKCRCFAGEEFNRTTESGLKMTEDTGFLECPPCVPCPDGRYREPGYPYNRCRKCRKDCDRLNKHWVTFCGGTSPGLCGHCYTGFIQSSIDPNSRCVSRKDMLGPPKVAVQPANNSHPREIAKLAVVDRWLLFAASEPIVCTDGFYKSEGGCHRCLNCSQAHRYVNVDCGDDVNEECGDCYHGFVNDSSGNCLMQTETDLSPRAYINPLTSFKVPWIITAFVLTLVMLAICICKLYKKMKRPKADPEAIGGSSIHFVSVRNDDPDNGSDTEADGQEDMVRGELDCSHSQSGFVRSPAPYPSVRISNKICKEISKLISGDEEVLAFFRTLGIDETIYNPHRDFFYKSIYSFREYVYRTMIQWSQLETSAATLDRVCTAMVKARVPFSGKVNELMDWYTRHGRERSVTLSEEPESDLEVDFNLNEN